MKALAEIKIDLISFDASLHGLAKKSVTFCLHLSGSSC